MSPTKKSIDDKLAAGLTAPEDVLGAFGVYTTNHAIADIDAQAKYLLTEREFPELYKASGGADTHPNTALVCGSLKINPGRKYRERGPKIK